MKLRNIFKISIITHFVLFFFIQTHSVSAQSKGHMVSGKVFSKDGKAVVAYALLRMDDYNIWTISDPSGEYSLKLPEGISQSEIISIEISCVGYVAQKIEVSIEPNRDISRDIFLEVQSLSIDEVVITASPRSNSNVSSSYVINKEAIDNLQAVSLTDVTALLPGGKFKGDESLLNSTPQIAIRGGSAFGTGIEIDGVRVDNNASSTATSGVDTRPFGVGNIESVEVITGIASVEYGDINSGVVKVNTTKGKTPWVISSSIKPHTQRYSISKGFVFGDGILNSSIERASSVSNLSHPYTNYIRNSLSLNYLLSKRTLRDEPLIFNFGLSGNIGGYNDQDDPDQKMNRYSKSNNNILRASASLDWSANRDWLTRLQWTLSSSYQVQRDEENSNVSSASSSVAMHSMSDGYYVASPYDITLSNDATLRPAGVWQELAFNENIPFNITSKIKTNINKRYYESILNRILIGLDYSYATNYGRGSYFDNLSIAPTWREYNLSELPSINTMALYAEDNLSVTISDESLIRLMTGVRYDATYIRSSEYGYSDAISPRINLSYNYKKIEVHAGWGRAVKLPSFSILYPRANYIDINTFSTASDDNNRYFQAYMTQVSELLYNPNLKMQKSDQTEIGLRVKLPISNFSVTAYHSVLSDKYTLVHTYSPFSYNYTSPAALESLSIPSEYRLYGVHPETGIVTVSDSRGIIAPTQLDYTTYKKFRSTPQYINGSDVTRMGVEWVVDFAKIKSINTAFRIDGNFTHYKYVDELLQQSSLGLYRNGADGQPYKYIGHYVGGASVANGEIDREVNLNLTITTHIPKTRLIVSLRVESTLLDYFQNISEMSSGNRSYAVENAGDYIGTDPNIYGASKYVVSYPKYYSSWDNQSELIPFLDKYKWAKENDRELYNDLSQLVEKSNYAFTFNPLTISSYFSANLTITKEIGDLASVSFFATNFLNNMQQVKSSWGSVYSGSIYRSGYIPQFYYGLSFKLKL